MKQSYIICGRSGAGKGTVSQILEAKTGGNIFRLSSIPEKFLKEFDIAETRENYAKMSGLLRSTFGEDIFLRAIEHFIANPHNTILIFDGPRKLNAVKKIQELTESTLIYINTPPHLRYERSTLRSEKHDEASLTFEQFLEQEEFTPENELEIIQSFADVRIENNGTREELFRKIYSHIKTTIS